MKVYQGILAGIFFLMFSAFFLNPFDWPTMPEYHPVRTCQFSLFDSMEWRQKIASYKGDTGYVLVWHQNGKDQYFDFYGCQCFTSDISQVYANKDTCVIKTDFKTWVSLHYLLPKSQKQ